MYVSIGRKVTTDLPSIIFQKSCPWFQNQPTEIKGCIAALSPNPPFLGCFHFIFVVFAVWSTFHYLFFLETVFAPIQKRIPDSRSMWIPDSSPLDSGFQHQKFAGFQIADCYMQRQLEAKGITAS